MKRVLAINGALIGIDLGGMMFDKSFQFVGLQLPLEILRPIRHFVEASGLKQCKSDGNHLVGDCHGSFLPELSPNNNSPILTIGDRFLMI